MYIWERNTAERHGRVLVIYRSPWNVMERELVSMVYISRMFWIKAQSRGKGRKKIWGYGFLVVSMVFQGECIWFSGMEAAEPANFAPNSRVVARDDWQTDGCALAENGGHSDNFCSAWYPQFIKLVRRGIWNKGARFRATDKAESWNRESNVSTGPLLSTRRQV